MNTKVTPYPTIRFAVVHENAPGSVLDLREVKFMLEEDDEKNAKRINFETHRIISGWQLDVGDIITIKELPGEKARG